MKTGRRSSADNRLRFRGDDIVNGYKGMIDNATVQIYEYGIDRQTYMNHTNRIFPFYVMSYISEGAALLRIGNKE